MKMEKSQKKNTKKFARVLLYGTLTEAVTLLPIANLMLIKILLHNVKRDKVLQSKELYLFWYY